MCCQHWTTSCVVERSTSNSTNGRSASAALDTSNLKRASFQSDELGRISCPSIVSLGLRLLIPETIIGALAAHDITMLRKCFYLNCLCSRTNGQSTRAGFSCHAGQRFHHSYFALIILPGIDGAVPSHLTSTASLTTRPASVVLSSLFQGRGHAYIFLSMSVLPIFSQTNINYRSRCNIHTPSIE
jgi:hypothetical protein